MALEPLQCFLRLAKSHCLASQESWVQCIIHYYPDLCFSLMFIASKFITNLISLAFPPKLSLYVKYRRIKLILVSFFK